MFARLIAHDLLSDCVVMRGKRNTCAVGILNLQGFLPIKKNNCKFLLLLRTSGGTKGPEIFGRMAVKISALFGYFLGNQKVT